MGIYPDPTRIDTSATPISESVHEITNPSQWHSTSTLPDGTPIGRLGAYRYVLDENGTAISDGYHEIYLDENGDYRGKRSARTTRITLHTEPD